MLKSLAYKCTSLSIQSKHYICKNSIYTQGI